MGVSVCIRQSDLEGMESALAKGAHPGATTVEGFRRGGWGLTTLWLKRFIFEDKSFSVMACQ